MIDWLAAQPPERLAISGWVTAEFSSALSIKVRVGHLSVTNRAQALAMFTRLRAETFSEFPVAAAEFRVAARFADQHALGLRSGDARHLAICAEHGATLCTLDHRQSDAGRALGVSTARL